MSNYKLTIETDPDDPSSMKDLKAASKSRDMAIALFRIVHHLPKEAESFEENNNPSSGQMKEFFQNRISQYLSEESIDIEDITE